MVDLYIKNTNISVHCLQFRVKVMSKKCEDSGEMDVINKEKSFFSKNVTFFKQKYR